MVKKNNSKFFFLLYLLFVALANRSYLLATMDQPNCWKDIEEIIEAAKKAQADDPESESTKQKELTMKAYIRNINWDSFVRFIRPYPERYEFLESQLSSLDSAIFQHLEIEDWNRIGELIQHLNPATISSLSGETLKKMGDNIAYLEKMIKGVSLKKIEEVFKGEDEVHGYPYIKNLLSLEKNYEPLITSLEKFQLNAVIPEIKKQYDKLKIGDLMGIADRLNLLGIEFFENFTQSDWEELEGELGIDSLTSLVPHFNLNIVRNMGSFLNNLLPEQLEELGTKSTLYQDMTPEDWALFFNSEKNLIQYLPINFKLFKFNTLKNMVGYIIYIPIHRLIDFKYHNFSNLLSGDEELIHRLSYKQIKGLGTGPILSLKNRSEYLLEKDPALLTKDNKLSGFLNKIKEHALESGELKRGEEKDIINDLFITILGKFAPMDFLYYFGENFKHVSTRVLQQFSSEDWNNLSGDLVKHIPITFYTNEGTCFKHFYRMAGIPLHGRIPGVFNATENFLNKLTITKDDHFLSSLAQYLRILSYSFPNRFRTQVLKAIENISKQGRREEGEEEKKEVKLIKKVAKYLGVTWQLLYEKAHPYIGLGTNKLPFIPTAILNQFKEHDWRKLVVTDTTNTIVVKECISLLGLSKIKELSKSSFLAMGNLVQCLPVPFLNDFSQFFWEQKLLDKRIIRNLTTFQINNLSPDILNLIQQKGLFGDIAPKLNTACWQRDYVIRTFYETSKMELLFGKWLANHFRSFLAKNPIFFQKLASYLPSFISGLADFEFKRFDLIYEYLPNNQQDYFKKTCKKLRKGPRTSLIANLTKKDLKDMTAKSFNCMGPMIAFLSEQTLKKFDLNDWTKVGENIAYLTRNQVTSLKNFDEIPKKNLYLLHKFLVTDGYIDSDQTTSIANCLGRSAALNISLSWKEYKKSLDLKKALFILLTTGFFYAYFFKGEQKKKNKFEKGAKKGAKKGAQPNPAKPKKELVLSSTTKEKS